MKIFSGSSNIALAQSIAKNLTIPLGKSELTYFPNGECRVWLKEKVEGEICIVVQSLSVPVNDHIIQFLLIVDALYRMGASKILAVIPWIGYSPQDKIFRYGEPLSAKVIGSVISRSLVDRIFTFDVHNESIIGFFSKPLEQLTCDQLFTDYLKKNIDLTSTIVVCPDLGAIKRSRSFSRKLKVDYFVIDKTRNPKTGQVDIHGISGSVKNRVCLLFDDFISTGQTAILTASFLKKNGAQKVIFSSTHHFDIKNVSGQLQQSSIDQILISNTISVKSATSYSKIKVLDVSDIITKSLGKWI